MLIEGIQDELVEWPQYKEDIESLVPLFSESGSEYLPSGSDATTTDDEMPNHEGTLLQEADGRPDYNPNEGNNC
ncbi:hypothetical protein JTE90_022841 [Oedothorax gibbosus]|uniref:Uncharacterized protein n=1 Tax=Oedothorax gibbosus TaxID=931172 RepID=A0AAV6TMX8_9ARAC|nr:hypothetical protein JTE90_022841 [Oedothorax gibbosus]